MARASESHDRKAKWFFASSAITQDLQCIDIMPRFAACIHRETLTNCRFRLPKPKKKRVNEADSVCCYHNRYKGIGICYSQVADCRMPNEFCLSSNTTTAMAGDAQAADCNVIACCTCPNKKATWIITVCAIVLASCDIQVQQSHFGVISVL